MIVKTVPTGPVAGLMLGAVCALGATGCGGAAVTVIAAEVDTASGAVPLLQVTRRLMACPARPVVSKLAPVAPAMVTPSASHCRAAIGAGVPDAVPTVPVKVLPSTASPLIVGAAVTAGGVVVTVPRSDWPLASSSCAAPGPT